MRGILEIIVCHIGHLLGMELKGLLEDCGDSIVDRL